MHRQLIAIAGLLSVSWCVLMTQYLYFNFSVVSSLAQRRAAGQAGRHGRPVLGSAALVLPTEHGTASIP